MKKLLNTLYVTTPDAYISKDGSNIVVSTSGQERFRIPVSNIESIYTFGYQGASPGVMKLCADNGVALSFFSPHGRFIARLQGPVRGNIMLRSRQYEIMGAPLARQFAALFVSGKIYNSRVTLRRFIRDYPQRTGADEVESTT